MFGGFKGVIVCKAAKGEKVLETYTCGSKGSWPFSFLKRKYFVLLVYRLPENTNSRKIMCHFLSSLLLFLLVVL